MPTQEMRALWHPTRVQIFDSLKTGPATRSQLAKACGAPYAEVAYHCRSLRHSGCIKYGERSGPHSADPLYEVA